MGLFLAGREAVDEPVVTEWEVAEPLTVFVVVFAEDALGDLDLKQVKSFDSNSPIFI